MQKKQKILFLTLSTFDVVGGIQTFNKYFKQALDENDYKWLLLSLHDSASNNANNIFCCDSRIILFINKLIHFSSSDVIVVWNHISLARLWFFLRFIIRAKKNILLAYGTELWDRDLPFLKKKALILMDEIWSISDYTKQRIINDFHIESERLKIFPCCIEATPDHNRDNPYDESKFNIVTLLRLDESRKLKAVFNVLDVLLPIKNSGLDVHFTIIGDGNSADKIKQYIKQNHLTELVSLTGYVKDASRYLEHCDVFSLVSDGEGFGIVYLEAMQYKKCCIAANNCGSKDVVLNGITGLSVDVDDLAELERIIKWLYENPAERMKMGENGYQHLMQNFTFKQYKINQYKLLGA